MNTPLTNDYLARARAILGDRTDTEIEYDKPPLPNGINPKTIWNGNDSDLKKSAENWTRPSIFAAFTGIFLAHCRLVSSPC
jgi:hypothetical protein